MCVQNLKFTALPVPEIIGALIKLCMEQGWEMGLKSLDISVFKNLKTQSLNFRFLIFIFFCVCFNTNHI